MGSDRILFSRARTVLKIGCFLTAAIVALSVFALGALIVSPAEVNFAGALTRIDRATAEHVARGMLIGVLVMAPLVFVVLRILLRIIETALAGDPFIRDNGRRLRQIAWYLAILNVLWAVTFTWANALIAKAQGLPSPVFAEVSWLAFFTVVMLFVIARIFEYGSEMRTELQGTV